MKLYRIMIDIKGHLNRNMMKEMYFSDEKNARIMFERLDNFLLDMELHEIIIFYRIWMTEEDSESHEETSLF